MVGYKIINNTYVHEARDIDQAAELVARFYPTASRARVRETLTSDRPLNAAETEQLANKTAALLLKEMTR